MKVIAINGSPNEKGNTYCLLASMCEELKKENIDTEIVSIGRKTIRGCFACGVCKTTEDGMCVFTGDITNETIVKMREADGIILGSPTYYANISGTMKAFLDRAFFSSSGYFKYKVGAAISSVRRAGGIDVVAQINNYFQLAQMVISPSQYWSTVYGMLPGEVADDKEGLQTIRRQAQSMAWLLKVIDQSKGKVELPPNEERVYTNFIR